MKNRIVKLQLSTYFLLSTLSLSASVPLKWTVETSRLQPAFFDVVRGERIDLETTFQSYGKPLSMTNHPCCIFWQTNGMGNAWWTSAASATSNRVTAAFTPQMDPGGATVNGFLGSTGQIYRAAFTLRFRHGPGADPNVIDQPPRILDLAHTVVVNPPWPTQADFAATTTVMRADLKTYIDGQITEAGIVTPTMTTNIATAVVHRDVSEWAIGNNELPQLVYNGIYERGEYDGISSFKLWVCRTSVYSPNKANIKIIYDTGDVFEGEVTIPFSSAACSIYKTSGFVNVQTTGYIYSIPYSLFEKMNGKMIHPSEFIKYTIEAIPSWARNENPPTETDPTVPQWAKADNPPESMTDNAVVLTNNELKTKGGADITAETIGVPAWARSANKPTYTVEEVSGAQTESSVQTAIQNAGHASASDLTTLAGTVATVSAKADQANLYSSGVYQYMIGNTNAWFAETNYVTNAEITNRTHFAWEDGMNAGTVPGSLALWEIRDGQRQRVWDQRDWTAWYWSFKAAQLSNNMARVIGAVADEVGTNCMKRGWAKYTAVRGLDNPDPSALVVDTQKVQLFAGHQWEKLVETGGSGYWTLTGNGIELSAADTTNTFLTVKDFEGNACLTFRKTSSYLVYCECGTDITSNYMDGQGRVVFHITTDVQPTAEFSTTLDLDDFVEQGESGCPANYEWTGSAGNWDCHFLLKPGIVASACFARFKVMREGQNVVEHTIPIKINGGIIFDHNGQSVKIRPTVTSTEVGSTVNWVVAQ